MSGSLEQQSNLLPTYRRDQESIWIEVRKLWKGVNNSGTNRLYDIPFSLAGHIYNSESSPWLVPNFGGRLVAATASLLISGTSDTIISIRKNGTQVASGSITISSGVHTIFNQGVDDFFSADSDFATVAVTTSGLGAIGLTVQLRFKMS